MKTSLIGFLCLTLISLASCQYRMTQEVTKVREDVLKKFYEWAFEIDTNFYDASEDLATQAIKTFSSYTSVQEDISAAIKTLQKSILNVPNDLTKFIFNLDQTFNNFDVSQVLGSFAYNGPTYHYPEAHFIDISQWQLENVVEHVSLNMYPNNLISEDCGKNMLKKLASLFETFVDTLIAKGKKLISSYFPKIRADVTPIVDGVVVDLKIFRDRIRKCNLKTTTLSKETCAKQIVQDYPSSAIFTDAIVSSFNQFAQRVQTLVGNEICDNPLYYEGSFNDEFQHKVDNIKYYC